MLNSKLLRTIIFSVLEFKAISKPLNMRLMWKR